jgi:hypothetical protein
MFRLNCFKIIIRLILATGQAEKGAMDFIGLTQEDIGRHREYDAEGHRCG